MEKQIKLQAGIIRELGGSRPESVGRSELKKSINKARLVMAAAALGVIGSMGLGAAGIDSYPDQEAQQFRDKKVELAKKYPDLKCEHPFASDRQRVDEVVDRIVKGKKDAPELNRLVKLHSGDDLTQNNHYALEHHETDLVCFLKANPPLVDEMVRNEVLKKDLMNFFELELKKSSKTDLYFAKIAGLFLAFPSIGIAAFIFALRKSRELRKKIKDLGPSTKWEEIQELMAELRETESFLNRAKREVAVGESRKAVLLKSVEKYQVEAEENPSDSEPYRIDAQKMRVAEVRAKLRLAMEKEDVAALEELMAEARRLELASELEDEHEDASTTNSKVAIISGGMGSGGRREKG